MARRLKKPAIVERRGHRYVKAGVNLYEIRIIKGAKSSTDLLNYAAVAVDLGVSLCCVQARQDAHGWPGAGGERLKVHWRSVLDALGREKRVRFLLRADVDKGAPASRADDSQEQFWVNGKQVMGKSYAVRRLGWTRGRKCQAACKRYGLRFHKAVSPFTRRRLDVCDVSDVERVEAELAARKEPPTLEGRPTMWLRDLMRADGIGRCRSGRRAASASQGMHWITVGCKYLDGERLRGEQAPNRSWYVERAQAERIIAAAAGKSSRATLNQSEVCREFGYDWAALKRMERAGKLRPLRRPNATSLRQILYLRSELDSIRAEECRWIAPAGFEPIPETRERHSRSLNPPQLLSALKAGRQSHSIAFVRHPVTDAFYHQARSADRWLDKWRDGVRKRGRGRPSDWTECYRYIAERDARAKTIREAMTEYKQAHPEKRVTVNDSTVKRARVWLHRNPNL